MAKIYKLTNNINNKIYIGCTIKTLIERFNEHTYRALKSEHNSKLYNSIRKYGIENFTMELITECHEHEMFEKEIEYIKEYNSFKNGLNSTLGGDGCLGYKHSQEIREKISNIIKNGKSHKDKTYEQIYGDKSNEQKQIRSLKTKEHWDKLTEEEREEKCLKISSNINRKFSIEIILDIIDKFKAGYKPKEIKQEYPEISMGYLYDLKLGKRCKNIQKIINK